MNLSTLKNKKSLKIAAMLVTSLIIASASAATYSELFMYGSSITITDNRVILEAGTDTPNISTLGVVNDGTEVTFDKIQVAKGTTVTYDEAVKITNNAGEDRSVAIDVTTFNSAHWSDDFDHIYITMYSGTTQMGDQIQYLATGSNVTSTGTPVTIPNGATWTVQWEIEATVGASASDTVSLTARIMVS
jgi:hypothetical protein